MPEKIKFVSGNKGLANITSEGLVEEVLCALLERREKQNAFGDFAGISVRSSSRDKALLFIESLSPRLLNEQRIIPEIRDLSNGWDPSSEDPVDYVKSHRSCYLIYDPEGVLNSGPFYRVDLDECY